MCFTIPSDVLVVPHRAAGGTSFEAARAQPWDVLAASSTKAALNSENVYPKTVLGEWNVCLVMRKAYN